MPTSSLPSGWLLLPDCCLWAVRWIGSGRAEAFPFAVFMWSVVAMVHALARSVFGFGAERGWTGNWARQTAMLIRALAVVPIVFASRATHLWTGVLLVGKHFYHRVGHVSAACGRVGRRLRRHGGRGGRSAHRKDRLLHSPVDRLVPPRAHPRRFGISRCTCSRSCSCSQTSTCSGGDRVGPRSSAAPLARRTLSSSHWAWAGGAWLDPSMSGALSEGGFVSSVVNKES